MWTSEDYAIERPLVGYTQRCQRHGNPTRTPFKTIPFGVACGAGRLDLSQSCSLLLSASSLRLIFQHRLYPHANVMTYRSLLACDDGPAHRAAAGCCKYAFARRYCCGRSPPFGLVGMMGDGAEARRYMIVQQCPYQQIIAMQTC